MIAEENNSSKPEEVRKNMNKSYNIKTADYIPVGFVLAIYYLEDITHTN